jgi:hypothetical protein
MTGSMKEKIQLDKLRTLNTEHTSHNMIKEFSRMWKRKVFDKVNEQAGDSDDDVG